MSTSVFDIVDSFKRSLAVPGEFDTYFPNSSEDDLAFTLLDAFGECQLDGFFTSYTADDDGLITEDLTRAEKALLVIYASVRVLRSEIRNRKSHKRYEAGSVVFEEDQAASVLTQLLKSYEEEKKELRKQGLRGNVGGAFYMADMYVMRAVGATYWS